MMACSILNWLSTDDDTPMWKMEFLRKAHEYAREKYPFEYHHRNCRSGFHDVNYRFISAVMESYRAGLEDERFKNDELLDGEEKRFKDKMFEVLQDCEHEFKTGDIIRLRIGRYNFGDYGSAMIKEDEPWEGWYLHGFIKYFDEHPDYFRELSKEECAKHRNK